MLESNLEKASGEVAEMKEGLSKVKEECLEKAEALDIERMKVKELEEKLGRIAKNEQDLENRLLEAQSASTELKLEHGELEEVLRSYEMLKEVKEVLEQELESKIEEVLAREELIKKGTAMVEDL